MLGPKSLNMGREGKFTPPERKNFHEWVVIGRVLDLYLHIFEDPLSVDLS